MRAIRWGFAAFLLAVSAHAEPKSSADVLNRGQQLSTAIAAITSTAISPLLGVSLLGVYDYARASPEARATLPFYSKPHFWIPIGVLLLLIFFKDSVGSTVPLLKKPLDAIEVLVINKAALVLIAFPVMFHQVSKLTGIRDIAELVQPVVYASQPGALEHAGHIGAAAVLFTAGFMITLVVWVVGHAADVLALLSPVPLLDVLVKASRAAVMLTVAGCAVLSPALGLIASGIVIAACAMLFWLALRILILGWKFGSDVLLWRKKSPANGEPVDAVAVGKIRGMPRNVLGQLACDSYGMLEFRYRRMSIGPVRRVRLEHASAYEVRRGILFPCILLTKAEKRALQFRLLPRYRGSEQAVCAALGLAEARDFGLKKSAIPAAPLS